METRYFPAEDRGIFEYGWLKTAYSFSFGSYHRPDRVHFGMLRVLNDDVIAPGKGFGTHPHENMEIVTIPLSGKLAHKDSMGHVETISPGEVQAMSAGTGITHSEYNASGEEETSLLQIWIIPREKDVEPRYDQKRFDFTQGEMCLLVSPDGHQGSLTINQDARFYRGSFPGGGTCTVKTTDGNGLYLFLIEGSARVAGHELGRRDAIGCEGSAEQVVSFIADSDLLCIEVPMR